MINNTANNMYVMFKHIEKQYTFISGHFLECFNVFY